MTQSPANIYIPEYSTTNGLSQRGNYILTDQGRQTGDMVCLNNSLPPLSGPAVLTVEQLFHKNGPFPAQSRDIDSRIS
ncbi:hypothetical protein FHK02_5032 [Spirosoma sp. LMG 31448]|uniref:Uncharacterized protein n=1 Tax=Spirosoma utsteinense TaxID=2585773 RepID=A0ABR6WCZ7_9BACT|nr:hypothetical protein [Spirosoma utsteinense]MBC3794444.1 hypothetical protein [Spirosoma utsteinense]